MTITIVEEKTAFKNREKYDLYILQHFFFKMKVLEVPYWT